MSKPTIHYGTHTGKGLRAPSFVAEVLSYSTEDHLEFTVRKARNRKSTAQKFCYIASAMIQLREYQRLQ